MIQIRLGTSWKDDPSLRAAFARGSAAARAAAAHAVDALALEVDGVDITAGRAEGALLGGVTALCRALLRLLAGAARAEVHFSEGGVELILARRGASALLTVVALDRPARVLARDVEVELAELARAARDAARALCDELQSLDAKAVPAVTAELRQVAASLDGARAAPPPEPETARGAPRHRPRRRRGAPTCAFELRDEDALLSTYRGPGPDLGSLLAPGRVVLRGADGREVATLDGPPFLVLRDLAAFAGRLADAVRRGERSAPLSLAGRGRHGTVGLQADLAAGTLARAGGPAHPAPPLLLARALLEAAVDFCGVAAGRNPWQAQNGWLAELRTVASERLAHVQELIEGDQVAAESGRRVRGSRPRRLPRAPLGPGQVRRLAFRQLFRGDVGAPAGFGLALEGGTVVAAGAAAVVGLDPRTGAERWRRPGVRLAWIDGGALHLGDAARLAAADASTGRERWSRPLDGLPEGGPAVVRLAGGVALWVGHEAAAALEASGGRLLWTFAPPAGRALRAAAAGSLAVVGSAAGFLYGIEAASGRPAWRVRLPGPLATAPLVHGDALLALCATDLGGSLLALDPPTGRRRFEVPLDATPTGAVVPFAGLLGIPGTVAGDPVVAAVDPAGLLAWEDAPPLGPGPVSLAPYGQGLLVKAAGGTCLALDRGGTARWSRALAPRHPVEIDVPPLVARGVALVPGEGVEALELATGRPLGQAHLGTPVRLAADAELNLWALDAGGALCAARLATHLSVV
ncbi:MAG TPA: PQQ-binding-like beta-propeller repeat protein [Anaeromyxobacteraceae bacterium]|nr:PQQ-binding-like beta-propeller repeat protein [Anaeromyxobacteraceae bacterium]